MSTEPKTYLHPQGLRPGMRHEGSFKAGNDARRAYPSRRLPDGRTLASLARDYTEASVNVLVSAVTGQMADVRASDRIRAAEILLDRGWGKARETVQLGLNTADVGSLTRAELRAIAASALPPIEGEAAPVTASITAQTDREDAT